MKRTLFRSAGVAVATVALIASGLAPSAHADETHHVELVPVEMSIERYVVGGIVDFVFEDAIVELAGPSGFLPSAGLDPLRARNFRDVPTSHQFHREIQWLANQGISMGWVMGAGNYQFRPGANVERQAMAAFLYRGIDGSGQFGAPSRNTFNDIPRTDQMFRYIEWLTHNNITGGWPDNTFRAAQPVERQAMAAFLYRGACEPVFRQPDPRRATRDEPSPFISATFNDVRVTDRFAPEIEWLASTNITTGWTVGNRVEFRPGASVERQAMAAFLFRANSQGLLDPPAHCIRNAPNLPNGGSGGILTVLNQINHQRVAAGRSVLQADAAVSRIAQDHARAMHNANAVSLIPNNRLPAVSSGWQFGNAHAWQECTGFFGTNCTLVPNSGNAGQLVGYSWRNENWNVTATHAGVGVYCGRNGCFSSVVLFTP
ncbi:MAG: S-layer homology domain-containing protein [Promicromonosporaceae bacterium]|nr:S-layer homology domain-containing protein [Promicromonosporaceae bacterium]